MRSLLLGLLAGVGGIAIWAAPAVSPCPGMTTHHPETTSTAIRSPLAYPRATTAA